MKKALLGLSLLMAASSAMAATPGHYAGVSLGQTELTNPEQIETLVVDKTDTSYKLYMGYQLSENFALESFYTDLGDMKLANDKELGADAFGFSVVASYPVNAAIDVYGKLGMSSWQTDDATEDGKDAVYGVGTSFTEGDITLKAEYERFQLNDTEIDSTSVSIQYNF